MELFDWKSVSRGEVLPEFALAVGTYGMDGMVYVGRLNGEVGKINLKDGKMWNFRAHHQSHSYNAEVLTCSEVYRWVPLQKGDVIPAHAVKSGETPTDGVVFVGHSSQEPGKINVNSGKMNHFWSHNQGKCYSAHILVVEPAPSRAAAPATVAEPARSGPPAPTLPASFPHLPNLSQDELAQLQASEVLQTDLLQELPGVRDYMSQLKALSQENAKSAEELLEKQDGVRGLVQQYELDAASVGTLRNRVVELAAEKDLIKAQQSPEGLASRLQSSAAADDHEAESMLNNTIERADSLAGGSLSDFCRQFVQSKQRKHTKLALKEMILAA